MKKGNRYSSVLLPGCLFLLLIIDRDATVAGAAEGIVQCLQVIVPSLFPFFFITCWFNSRLLGVSSSFLGFIEQLLHLPRGCGSIFLTGLLGGYPVGAKTVTDAFDCNLITKKTARILLGYCNNAGPAFIFGISHILFAEKWIPWVIWIIQIISALITSRVLPQAQETGRCNKRSSNVQLTEILSRSISITAAVCGWILLFKILLQILGQISFIKTVLPFTAGILELSNGCIILKDVIPLSLRFILFSSFLSFGGLCVYLQTASVVSSIGTGLYFTGKCIQAGITALISIPVSIVLFCEYPMSVSMLLVTICVSISMILLLSFKCRKNCGNYECNHV